MSPPAWGALDADLRRTFARRGAAPDLVDDLVQEAAERVLRGLPGLRDRDRLGPYVGRVASSVWIDHLRRRRPIEALPDTLAAPPPDTDPDLTEEVAGWLPRMIDELPEAYREAMRLSEIEGSSQREVAQRLGLSASGARTRVQRGRKLLREVLEACCTIEREGARVVGYTRRTCDCA